MRTRYRLGVALLGMGALFVGCIDFGGPSDDALPEGLVISEPHTTLVSSAPGFAASPAAGPESWVSASPGTFPGAIMVEIRNVTADGPSTGPIAVMDGGFDPAGIAAVTGDELELAVFHPVDGVASLSLAVPARRPPVVVRTRPPDGRIDVALNVRPEVVFSEPIDPATLTRESVQLLRDGTPVDGSVALLPESPFTARFVPTTPLASSTTHQLVVTREIRDLDGVRLEAEVRATFTTAAGPATPLPSDQIFFVSTRDRVLDNCCLTFTSDIYVMNADGSGQTRLTDDPAEDFLPAVSPDGRTVLFVSDRPNDNSLVWIMNADGSAQRGLSRFRPGEGMIGGPSWSPDGNWIAYTGDGHIFDIWVATADWSSTARLTDTAAYDNQPVWSPDGTRIAFSRGSGEYVNETWDIVVMWPDGSHAINLTNNDTGSWLKDPAWSPDATRIAYVEWAAGEGYDAIWVMNADGSGRVRLTNGDFPATTPCWSPGGSRIAFTRQFVPADGPITSSDVFVMNADGSNLVNLTNQPDSWDVVGSSQCWSSGESRSAP